MKHRNWLVFLILCALSILVMASPAHAIPDFITAYGWVSTEAIVGSATGASPASLALPTCHNGVAACTTANADATFTTTGISFSATDANVAAWLASSGFALHGLVDNVPSSLMDPTIWMFTGNASFTSPDPFTITHDDGATFIVNGQTVVNAPGPTAPVITNGTYTGAPGGSLPFELVYAECCSGPAVLQTDLVGPQNPPVPEPATLLLLGSGLAGLSGLAWTRNRK